MTMDLGTHGLQVLLTGMLSRLRDIQTDLEQVETSQHGMKKLQGFIRDLETLTSEEEKP